MCEVTPGYNPALATKQPRRRIARQCLNLDEWQKIFAIADVRHQYMGNAMQCYWRSLLVSASVIFRI